MYKSSQKKEENELKIQEDMINTFKDSVYEINPCQSPVHRFMESVTKQIEEANLSSSSFLNIQIKKWKIIKRKLTATKELSFCIIPNLNYY